ncbi:myocardial zonula adherens protein isoform X2 [Syngnathoides biaculeatus]|uniref:myocardial zonula adherens protein isoform X2 n=1 Tax=Syngnathoides biaculeatus TaxID=300417 RepID=UPI002ADDB743|nr:myocardial zonula adherens protein isoform X2 [Syngnathoides biaculeatus]
MTPLCRRQEGAVRGSVGGGSTEEEGEDDDDGGAGGGGDAIHGLGVDTREDMLHYGPRRTFSSTTTTTTADSSEATSERTIRRLRLTLHPGDEASKERKPHPSDTDGWKKRNGIVQRERPAGRESPKQHPPDTTNGQAEPWLQHRGPKMYGVVQRSNPDRQQEVTAREWTVSHLHDEMRYIREVRDSLEKVRERMYGQFGGMQQSVQKLSQEIKTANSHRRTLESEVRVRTAAMERFDQMNNSLISSNINLQKSLLDNCQNRVDAGEELKTLRSTCERTQEQLRDKDRELATAHAENQTLRLQVEASREANTRALMELSMALERDYQEKLLEEQRKHREEIEILQAQLDDYIRRLEEAEMNLRSAQAKIAERDQRIGELERLLDCMGTEKSQLLQKLQECERRLRLLGTSDATDGAAAKRSQELQREAGGLRERIKHLNDMVFCQQRKVKGMIEEVQTLRAQVAEKDMFISELLDRIAMVECESSEDDDLDFQKKGLVCNTLPRVEEVPRHDVESPIVHQPTHHHPINHLPPEQPLFVIPPPPQIRPPPPPDLSSPHTFASLPPDPPLSPTNAPLPPLPSSPTPPSSPTSPPSSPTPPPSSPTQASAVPPTQPSNLYLTMATQPRTFRSNNPPPSRLESSLLRFTPIEYSRYLEANPTPQIEMYSSAHIASESQSYECQPRDEVDAGTDGHAAANDADGLTPSRRAAPRLAYLDTPFMKLMEITANIKVE